MSLSEWLADGSIKAHPSSRTEIGRLLAIVDRDLADANVPGLTVDRRFATAYEAALQLASSFDYVRCPGPIRSPNLTPSAGLERVVARARALEGR